jgi:hypothetical protein
LRHSGALAAASRRLCGGRLGLSRRGRVLPLGYLLALNGRLGRRIGGLEHALVVEIQGVHGVHYGGDFARRERRCAVAITLAVTIVVMGIFLADGISTLLNALIPLRAFQPIEVM